MNKLKYLAFGLALGFVAISCGDDDDSAAPIVNMTAPTDGSTYTVADTILLSGTVTEDTKLQTVIISSDLGQDFNLTPMDSDTSHDINANLTLDSLTTAGDYTLTVTATDEAGDTILLSGTVTEDTKLQTVIISSDLGQDFNLTPLDSDTSHVINVNLTLDSLTTAGDYTLTVTVTDEAGNAGTDAVQITIQ